MKRIQRFFPIIIPFLCIFPIWVFLIPHTYPFLIMFEPDTSDIFYTEKMQHLFFLFFTGIGILNLCHAYFLSAKLKMKELEDALLFIRSAAALTYFPLLCTIGFSIFIMTLGGSKGEKIFFLSYASFLLLNLSGAFYAVPVILKLKKEHLISPGRAIFYIIFEFIWGADIFITLHIAKKINRSDRISFCIMMSLILPAIAIAM